MIELRALRFLRSSQGVTSIIVSTIFKEILSEWLGSSEIMRMIRIGTPIAVEFSCTYIGHQNLSPLENQSMQLWGVVFALEGFHYIFPVLCLPQAVLSVGNWEQKIRRDWIEHYNLVFLPLLFWDWEFRFSTEVVKLSRILYRRRCS